MHRLAYLVALIPASAMAKPFDRPTPNPQSATAEFWFALASLALVVALWITHRVVRNR